MESSDDDLPLGIPSKSLFSQAPVNIKNDRLNQSVKPKVQINVGGKPGINSSHAIKPPHPAIRPPQTNAVPTGQGISVNLKAAPTASTHPPAVRLAINVSQGSHQPKRPRPEDFDHDGDAASLREPLPPSVAHNTDGQDPQHLLSSSLGETNNNDKEITDKTGMSDSDNDSDDESDDWGPLPPPPKSSSGTPAAITTATTTAQPMATTAAIPTTMTHPTQPTSAPASTPPDNDDSKMGWESDGDYDDDDDDGDTMTMHVAMNTQPHQPIPQRHPTMSPQVPGVPAAAAAAAIAAGTTVSDTTWASLLPTVQKPRLFYDNVILPTEHQHRITSIAFHPLFSSLFTGSSGNEILTHDLDLKKMNLNVDNMYALVDGHAVEGLIPVYTLPTRDDDHSRGGGTSRTAQQTTEARQRQRRCEELSDKFHGRARRIHDLPMILGLAHVPQLHALNMYGKPVYSSKAGYQYIQQQEHNKGHISAITSVIWYTPTYFPFPIPSSTSSLLLPVVGSPSPHVLPSSHGTSTAYLLQSQPFTFFPSLFHACGKPGQSQATTAITVAQQRVLDGIAQAYLSHYTKIIPSTVSSHGGGAKQGGGFHQREPLQWDEKPKSPLSAAQHRLIVSLQQQYIEQCQRQQLITSSYDGTIRLWEFLELEDQSHALWKIPTTLQLPPSLHTTRYHFYTYHYYYHTFGPDVSLPSESHHGKVSSHPISASPASSSSSSSPVIITTSGGYTSEQLDYFTNQSYAHKPSVVAALGQYLYVGTTMGYIYCFNIQSTVKQPIWAISPVDYLLPRDVAYLFGIPSSSSSRDAMSELLTVTHLIHIGNHHLLVIIKADHVSCAFVINTTPTAVTLKTSPPSSSSIPTSKHHKEHELRLTSNTSYQYITQMLFYHHTFSIQHATIHYSPVSGVMASVVWGLGLNLSTQMFIQQFRTQCLNTLEQSQEHCDALRAKIHQHCMDMVDTIHAYDQHQHQQQQRLQQDEDMGSKVKVEHMIKEEYDHIKVEDTKTEQVKTEEIKSEYASQQTIQSAQAGGSGGSQAADDNTQQQPYHMDQSMNTLYEGVSKKPSLTDHITKWLDVISKTSSTSQPLQLDNTHEHHMSTYGDDDNDNDVDDSDTTSMADSISLIPATFSAREYLQPSTAQMVTETTVPFALRNLYTLITHQFLPRGPGETATDRDQLQQCAAFIDAEDLQSTFSLRDIICLGMNRKFIEQQDKYQEIYSTLFACLKRTQAVLGQVKQAFHIDGDGVDASSSSSPNRPSMQPSSLPQGGVPDEKTRDQQLEKFLSTLLLGASASQDKTVGNIDPIDHPATISTTTSSGGPTTDDAAGNDAVGDDPTSDPSAASSQQQESDPHTTPLTTATMDSEPNLFALLSASIHDDASSNGDDDVSQHLPTYQQQQANAPLDLDYVTFYQHYCMVQEDKGARIVSDTTTTNHQHYLPPLTLEMNIIVTVSIDTLPTDSLVSLLSPQSHISSQQQKASPTSQSPPPPLIAAHPLGASSQLLPSSNDIIINEQVIQQYIQWVSLHMSLCALYPHVVLPSLSHFTTIPQSISTMTMYKNRLYCGLHHSNAMLVLFPQSDLMRIPKLQSRAMTDVTTTTFTGSSSSTGGGIVFQIDPSKIFFDTSRDKYDRFSSVRRAKGQSSDRFGPASGTKASSIPPVSSTGKGSHGIVSNTSYEHTYMSNVVQKTRLLKRKEGVDNNNDPLVKK